jgi:hypothetical protein
MLRKVDQTLDIASLSHGEEMISVPEGRDIWARFDEQARRRQIRPKIALNDLVSCIVASFRGHPHINNVLTHISGAHWNAVEQALCAILDPRSGSDALSPLAWNIVDLMCADRGVTGRILKPFYRELLVALLGDVAASRFVAHVTSLFLEREVAIRSTMAINPAGGSGSTSGAGGS